MKRSHVILMVVAAAVLLLSLLVFAYREVLVANFFRPTADPGVERISDENIAPEVVADNLNTPWSLAVLPDGDVLVSERTGTVQRIGHSPFVADVADVSARGEGGLLGLALDPSFQDTQFVYLYKTTQTDNRVERYIVENDGLSGGEVIFEGIPHSNNHNGGRIAFGPDGMLYIAAGDAGESDLAQDVGSLAGKILRITPQGEVPADNPFGTAVYSYGHRNVQGLAWDDTGALWASEHGRSGMATGLDELNRIQSGGNYGWPIIQGDESFADMHPPAMHSGAETTWAPGSLAYAQGSFYFGGLRGQSLYAVTNEDGELTDLRAYFTEEYGRLRDVFVHDKWLYMTTSNRDGRGSPRVDDDRILRIPLSQITTR